MKNLLLLIPLLMFVACSKSTTSTKLKVSSNFIFGGAALNGTYTAGGLMVWGQGPDGHAFGRSMIGVDTINLDLKNGSWTFYAMSWEIVTGNFTGKPRCAKSAISLAGEPVAVNLNLTNANCTDPVFGNNIHGTTPSISIPPAKVEWCSTSPSSVTSHTDKCTDDTTDITRKAAKGHGTSYRYRLRSFDRRGGATAFLTDEIASYCLDGNSSPATPLHSGVTSEMPGIPVGVGNTTPFHITMDVYVQSTDCEGATSPGDKKGAITVELPHGLQSQQPRLKYVVEPTGTGRSKVYIQISEADMCNGRATGSTGAPYAGGMGTAERPYLICSGAQFLKLPVTSPIMHFKLLADVNLNPFSKGLTTQGTETYFSCLEEGSNFLPIGKNTADCGVSAGTDFSGSFDGNNHSVTGMRIRLEDLDYVGMFGIMTGSGGIRNLKLLKSEISGRSYVGALVGSSTSNGTFSGIEVTNADIEARDDGSNLYGENAGGVFGSIFNATLTNISSRRSFIRADRVNAGGIAGTMDSVTASYLFASGTVEARENQVGGIAGNTVSPTISNSRFEGYISGDNLLGGLIGNSVGTTISNSYAHAGIYSTRPASSIGFNLGGLFGYFSGTSGTHTVTNAYFAGRIIAECSVGNTTCEIGQILGSTTGSVAGDFINVSYLEHGYASTTATNFGNPITSAQAYDGTTLAGLGGSFSLVANDLPRLSVEAPTHPCRLNNASATVAAQITAGRGSSTTNPILLCNPTQLAAIQTYPTRHYRLEGLIDGLDITASWPVIFSGSINGNGLGIVGMKLQGGSGDDIAWFDGVSGTIRNLAFLGSKVNSAYGSPGSGTTALITGELSGTLDKVEVYGLRWKSDKSGGAIANNITSTGRILNSELEIDMVAAGGYVGGVSQTNYGKIEGLELNGSIRSDAADYLYSVGGVVSENFGKIYRSEISIEMRDDQSTSGNYNALITQINRPAGIIEDVILDEARYFGSSLSAYGISYSNEGLIRRVYSNAEIQLSSGDPRPVYVVTGSNTGTIGSVVYSRYAELPDPTSSDSFGTSGSCDLLFGTYVAAGNWFTTLGTDPTNFIATVDQQQYRVTAYSTGPTDTVTISSACGVLGASTGIISYSPAELAGTYVSEASMGYADFSTWDGTTDSDARSIWVADMDDPAQEARVMAILGAHISGQPLPETPPVWEFKASEGLRLFTLD
ncbi:MAG: hypothetical protein ACLGG0_12635 [Bacteriovoracia bacterium]